MLNKFPILNTGNMEIFLFLEKHRTIHERRDYTVPAIKFHLDQ